jgi:hypothetical protein
LYDSIPRKGLRESQKEKDEFLWNTEMYWDEKSAGSRKTRESAEKYSDELQPFAPGPFALKEMAKPGGISSNAQNHLKGGAGKDGHFNFFFDSSCLADFVNGAAIGGSSQKGGWIMRIEMEKKDEKMVFSLLGL